MNPKMRNRYGLRFSLGAEDQSATTQYRKAATGAENV